jgi:hypothetical protein
MPSSALYWISSYIAYCCATVPSSSSRRLGLLDMLAQTPLLRAPLACVC